MTVAVARLARLGLAAAAAVVLAAPVARADDPSVTLDPVEASYAVEPTISGHATHDGAGSADMNRVDVTYESTLEAGPGTCAVPAAEAYTPAAGDDPNTPEVEGPTRVDFESHPDFECNGRYEVRVVGVSGREPANCAPGGIPCVHGERSTTVTGAFDLAVPPATPASLTAAVNDAQRRITLNWADNPEKDLLGYVVFRRGPSQSTFTAVDVVTASLYVDDDVAAAGGLYRYEVQAIRLGPSQDPDATDEVYSTNVAATSARAADHTTTTAPTGGGDGGGDGGGGTTETTAASGGSTGGTRAAPAPDRSGIDRLRAEAARRRQASFSTTTTDPGFDENLPFDPNSRFGDAPDGSFVLAGSSRDTFVDVNDRRGVWVPVATGLVLFLGATHLRMLSRRAAQPH